MMPLTEACIVEANSAEAFAALREMDLIHEELSDLSDSFQRSDDDGWFYSDED